MNNMAFQHKLFQIFRTGAHTSMGGAQLVFGKQDLEYIAAGYSKTRLRAPLVLGHPAGHSPAYGEVDSLFVKGEALYAQATVSDALAGMVRAGSYKYVSPCLMTPDTPGNPAPGAYYVRHVGFLGAVPPAVKGMAALDFAECSGQAFHGLPPGYQLDKGRDKVFMLAMEYQRVCPGISFSEAAQRAEITINNYL